MTITQQTKMRKVLFLIFNFITLILFYSPIFSLFSLSFESELYSHFPLIPLISAYLFYSLKDPVFFHYKPSYKTGGILISAAVILYIGVFFLGSNLSHINRLSIMIFSGIFFWVGGFTLFNGTQALRKAIFPLAFLLLMVPIPDTIMDKIITLLQHASANLSFILFKLTGVPIFREGLIFQLPNITIEVAKECSGIRSSIALFITCMLLQHFTLTTISRKIIFILFILPIAVLKNSIRIVTLSLLATYIDTTFLTNSFIHKKGGIIFFIIALMIMFCLLYILRKSEANDSKPKSLPTNRPA